MSSVSAANGFQAYQHPSGTPIRPTPSYVIASGYGYNIFAGDPVKLTDAGVLELATSDGTRSGTVDGILMVGIFAGVQYTDAFGKPQNAAFWPASTTATDVVASVYDDVETRFTAQYTNPSSGTTVQTAVGEECDWVVASPGGSTYSGISNTQLSAIQSTSGQFQIIGFVPGQTLTDSYLQAIVRINEHSYKASVNSI
jgi:hypothetical protein